MVPTLVRRAFSIDDEASDPDPQNSRRVSTTSRSDSYDFIEQNTEHRGPRKRLFFAMAVFVIVTAVILSVKGISNVITPATSGRNSFYDGISDTCEVEQVTTSSNSLLTNLEHAAVATDQPLCSSMATKILRDAGGNAVDAAVTAALCLGVANPSSSGLGGGGFMLIHAPVLHEDNENLPEFVDARTMTEHTTTPLLHNNRATEVIDCRETAPAAAYTEMYDNLPANASTLGGRAIPVLAELKCLELAHARFGSLPWSEVLKPVVHLAQKGVPITAYLEHVIQEQADKYRHLNWDYGLRGLLTRTDNWSTVLRQGETIHQNALGETLQDIQYHGVRALYKDRADTLAQEIQDAGGIVTADDLTTYRAVLRSPVSTAVNGFRLVGLPPPSSGGAAILGAVQFLGGFATPLAAFRSTLSQHRIVEACKHVFAIRMSLSDPDYNSYTVADAVKDLTSPGYMGILRKTAYRDNATIPLSNYGGDKWAQLHDTDGRANVTDAQEGDRRHGRKLLRPLGYLEDRGTSHFSIVDKDGNAVAMTTSINTVFGSAVRSPSTGIIFGNTMDDFGKPGLPNLYGLSPAESNFIKPGKRPLSSMSPTMVFREAIADNNNTDLATLSILGPLLMVLGASGGPKIITAVTQVLLNHILMGMPLLESLIHPRLHDQLVYHNAAVTTTENAKVLEDALTIEVSERTRNALTTRGHEILDIDYTGTVQVVSIDSETGRLSAACDPRKGGSPAGY